MIPSPLIAVIPSRTATSALYRYVTPRAHCRSACSWENSRQVLDTSPRTVCHGYVVGHKPRVGPVDPNVRVRLSTATDRGSLMDATPPCSRELMPQHHLMATIVNPFTPEARGCCQTRDNAERCHGQPVLTTRRLILHIVPLASRRRPSAPARGRCAKYHARGNDRGGAKRGAIGSRQPPSFRPRGNRRHPWAYRERARGRATSLEDNKS